MSKTHIKAFEAGLVSIIANELPPRTFFRISRGCIISVKAIQSIVKQVNGCLLVISDPPADFKMTVSRSRVDDFMGNKEATTNRDGFLRCGRDSNPRPPA